MSAQAGIFYFDGRPIEPDVPKRLDAQLAEFGPDGSGQHLAPGLVMVYRALHVTPEDHLERQPYVSERGNVMTWDGRLDNRGDLLLQLQRDLRDDTTDVALAMAAYERWGSEAFSRLVGDWSVAIFDTMRRSLVLASDFMGVRPLYYWRSDRMLAWSSSLAVLVRLSGRWSDVDSHFVLGQLVGVPEPDLTPYHDIASLSPAHAFVQHASGDASKRRFWRCGLARIDYAHHSQYVEHFQYFFKQAVGARLRAAGPVWCEVSGGLDSSSVACMAHALASSHGSKPPLRFVTHVIDLAPESDERRFAEEVQRHCGAQAHYVRCDDHCRLESGRWLVPVIRSPLFLEIARLMSTDGARVILSGRVGDGTMGNFPTDDGNLSGLLTDRRLKTFFAQAHAWSRASQDPIVTVIARSLAWFLPARLRIQAERTSFLRKQGSRGDARDLAHAFSLDARFASTHSLTLPGAVDAAVHGSDPRNPVIVKGVYEYAMLRRLQSCWTTPDTIWSHPLADRQLVEFVTAVPFGVLCPAGRPRALMKQALADILPPRIHRRFSKGYAPPYLMRALRPFAMDFSKRLRQLDVVQRGFVDPILLSRRLEALVSGALTHVGNLLSICAVELWLEANAANVIREAARSNASRNFNGALNSVDAISLRPGAVA
jgi:asparagine synthase (glutamine-hydrolysing)